MEEKGLAIAPHSLAVVLSRASGQNGKESSPLSPSVSALSSPHAGFQVFVDFKATNMQHFWNLALTRALAEVFFLGWIDEHVLLIHGREVHLQVLRNGWTRRTLKPPPGFHIRCIGDVSPISMSPISQSQFIPLGEILCLAISAMNAAHKPVNQEALVEHLTASFPGVPTPSLEVLRHTLNMLVRERKIYPTPEGYFIVTPQTYFITPSLIRSNNKWYHLDDRLQERPTHPQQLSQPCASPKSGNVTPSTPSCLTERPSRKNHNDSYNSRREDAPRLHGAALQSKPPKEQKADSQPSKTPNGGEAPTSAKEQHRGEPPSYPHPPPLTSPPVKQPPPKEPTEKSKIVTSFPYKTDTLTKKKEGSSGGGTSEKQSKRFGLRLFRLSFKKDKMRQLATFSAQFPPEEWPLRDEDMPTTPIPREIEMEIIRRINPDLTVENVARHTAVMKRLEEERTQKHKAGSSAQHSARSRRGRGHRRVPHGKSRSHSKPRTSRGEASEGSNWDLLFMERDFRFFSHSLVRSPREAMYTLERRRSGGATYLVHSNPNITESYCPVTPEWDVSGELAKRRTEMPFPEPSRGTCQSRVQRSHSHNQDRKSRHDRSDQAKERSRSMDNALKGPSLGPPEDFEASLEERSHYYTDDGTLRATQKSSHYSRIMFSAAKFHSDFNVPDLGKGSVDESRLRSTMERNKSRDSLPTYNELMGLSPKPSTDEYFQCNTSNETILTAPSPQAKSEYDTLTSSGGLRKGSPADRQTPHLTSPHKVEYKEDLSAGKGQSSSVRLTPSQTPEPAQNARLTPHQHNVDPGGGGGSQSMKRKEIFSKDTLFKPPHNALSAGYVDSSYSKSGTLRKASHAKSTEALDNPEPQQPSNSAASSASPALLQGCLEPTVPSASFDYYNVSDDEDDEEAEEDSHKELAKAEDNKDHREAGGNSGGGGGCNSGSGVVGGGEGTIKWLLEREKDHDLQRKLETNLTLLSPKETDNSSSQKSAHSARLDSMDSSSVTVDSGFNSPRTRESLASNTSSIVESNRRQNPALSPGHIGTSGMGLPFSFRAIPEPPGPQPDKLQKPSNCLASITSV
ncbi:storkhead-box protein 2 isoform X1 [Entelurus aequoreus]|uniref:storkhead-box protein 2 isoform X1 n=2 Tax=Entelurus aequoreus TaxID=161455 RepID=UPI002B1DCE23|nr:storkhead-box protein 2 isoform X1 [Entelurus aequoreus]